MISLAHAQILWAEDHGKKWIPHDAISQIPEDQFAFWFREISPLCPDRQDPDLIRRPANALNVEFAGPRIPRCKQRSPDGRGLAWLLSGGSITAYGFCEQSHCQRCGKDEND